MAKAVKMSHCHSLLRLNRPSRSVCLRRRNAFLHGSENQHGNWRMGNRRYSMEKNWCVIICWTIPILGILLERFLTSTILHLHQCSLLQKSSRTIGMEWDTFHRYQRANKTSLHAMHGWIPHGKDSSNPHLMDGLENISARRRYSHLLSRCSLSPKENKGWNILKIFSEEILEFTVDVHVRVLKWNYGFCGSDVFMTVQPNVASLVRWCLNSSFRIFWSNMGLILGVFIMSCGVIQMHSNLCVHLTLGLLAAWTPYKC